MAPTHARILAFGTAAVVALCAGCADLDVSSFLTWPSAVPRGNGEGRVTIQAVRNGRPADKGGSNLRQVGNVRAEAGIPYAVHTERDDQLTEAMTRLVADATTDAGIAIANPADPTPSAVLATNMTELWCDGYFGYKANVTLAVQVLDPATKTPRGEAKVHGSGGGDSCGPAIRGALASVYAELTKVLAAGHLREALLSGAPAGASAPSPAAAAPAPTAVGSSALVAGGCTADSECKHGRVCSAGRCTSAAAP